MQRAIFVNAQRMEQAMAVRGFKFTRCNACGHEAKHHSVKGPMAHSFVFNDAKGIKDGSRGNDEASSRKAQGNGKG